MRFYYEEFPFDSPQQTEIFNRLLENVRCVVCQNQNIADSSAMLAKDMRHYIYKQVRENKNEKEIETLLTERFGEAVLYNPPLNDHTFLLWGFPLILALLLGVFFRKWIFSKT